MKDTISRQAAIDAIRASASKYTGFMEMEMYTDDDAVEAIEGLSSAQPVRIKGRWKPLYGGKFCGGAYWFGCSECGHTVPDVSNGGWNFCPECGADMRGGDG